jgi:hypothetical protein
MLHSICAELEIATYGREHLVTNFVFRLVEKEKKN